jgi:purine-binding chemotaxis protein CheW
MVEAGIYAGIPSQPIEFKLTYFSCSIRWGCLRVQVDLVDQKVVIFSVGHEEYAVSITAVREVVPWIKPTPIPEVPAVVEGVIDLRGDIIPVIDLGRLFKTERLRVATESRIIVLEINGTQAGFVVDDVSEVHSVTKDAIVPPSPVLRSKGRGHSDVVAGILKITGNRLVVLVDVERIMANLDITN